MDAVILWGVGKIGTYAFESLVSNYNIIAWGDNDVYKQGLFYLGLEVLGVNEIHTRYRQAGIVVCLRKYHYTSLILSLRGLNVLGYFDIDSYSILPWEYITWDRIINRPQIYLYAGDLDVKRRYQFNKEMVCLSCSRNNFYTIKHDLRIPLPLKDNSVDFIQSEDVFEHIRERYFEFLLNEMHRVLKHSCHLRLSLPDYNSKFSKQGCFLNANGCAVFDPKIGGTFLDGLISDGGHSWYPTFDIVDSYIKKSKFTKYEWYLYHTSDGKKIKKKIANEDGFIMRIEENENPPMGDRSLIVDLFK